MRQGFYCVMSFSEFSQLFRDFVNVIGAYVKHDKEWRAGENPRNNMADMNVTLTSRMLPTKREYELMIWTSADPRPVSVATTPEAGQLGETKMGLYPRQNTKCIGFTRPMIYL